ncbi:MAG: VTT domain-containing protein [Acidobacteriota bacterium]
MSEKIKNNKVLTTFTDEKRKRVSLSIRTLIFALEISLIIILLIWWLSSEEIKKSRDLLVFFFYSFPAEFLIALVPHEPVIIYFGKFYSSLTVALVGIAGTSLAEILNYSIFKFVAEDLKPFKKITSRNKVIIKIIDMFYKAPFLALFIAGITPIPFYPFRFLVVLARYPLAKYIMAIILSRTPRFYILAFFGYAIKIPDFLLIVLFVFLIIAANVSLLKNFLKNKQKV